MEQTTKYYNPSIKGGLEFSREYYNLCYYEKLEIVTPLLQEGVDNITYDRIVKSLLQHSDPKTKKTYPVQRERRISKEARAADIAYKETHKIVQ